MTFLVVIGDSVKLDYTVEEDTRTYNYSITLQSGDAFVVNTSVHGFSYALKEVIKGTAPKDLVLREGSMLVTVERD